MGTFISTVMINTTPKALFGGWGERLDLTKMIFKRYPSCWSTTSSIDAILGIVRDKGLAPEDVDRIDITMTPNPYKLVGHPFEVGDNPRVNAQFNVRYCLASALLRKGLRLEHFDEHAIRELGITDIIDRIDVTADSELEKQGHNAAIMRVKTKHGSNYEKIVRLPRGGPESPLTREAHIERFNNCFGYARKSLPQENAERILSMVSQLEELPDIFTLIPLLVSQQ